MLRNLSYLAAAAILAGGAGHAGAQGLAAAPSPDSLRPLLEARALVVRLGPTLGPAIWPGFRPDTIPALLWLPARGFLLVGWPGAAPEGFTALPAAGAGTYWRGVDAKGVASTGAALGGRGVAQVATQAGESPANLAGLVVHEAFHVFESATGGAGGSRSENSALLADYPVFDAANEGDVALEGLLLADALRAPDAAGARAATERFLAVRESRQRRLDPEVAAFEEGAELNEGRAEYALVRAREASGGRPGLEDIAQRLDALPQPSRSVRLRFYATGAAQALLLDRLAGAMWKARLAEMGGTLQDALATAIDYRAPEEARRRAAMALHAGARLEAEARERTASLAARRHALADSLLARPGVLLVLVGDSIGRIGLCGFDPQNLLAAGNGLYLHTRWLRPCGGGMQGDLNAPTVEDRAHALLRVVIGPEDSVRVTVAGAPATLADGEARTGSEVRIDSPGASLTFRRAKLERHGRELRATPLAQ